MIYKDKIYGKVEIKEPVIIELINTPSLQRLKGINQAGYVAPFFYGFDYSRFDHSVGVFILLRRFHTSLEEQIAGLIHDVSHGAFSHGLDYALPTGSEKKHTHQDNIFQKFIKKSEIPGILKKHGIDLKFILDDKNFSLKEKSLPDLCADRIDYSMRDALSNKMIVLEDINYFLNNLSIINKSWVFKNFEIAKKYADFYLKMNRFYWAGLPTAIMFRAIGDYLKYSLKKKYIAEDDLYTSDKEVLAKINQQLKDDHELTILWDRLNNKVRFKVGSKDHNAHVFVKSRVVDPLFEDNGLVKRVSAVDKKWERIVQIESLPKEYFIRFES